VSEGLDWKLGLETAEAQTSTTKLDAVLGQLEKTLKGLDAHLGKIGGEAGKAGAATAGLGKAAGQAAGEVDKLGGHSVLGFHVIGEAVKRAIDGAISLGHKIFEVGEEILHAAAKAERTEKSFGLLFGAEGGEEMLSFVEHIAKNTEFTDDALKGVVAQLGKVGFAGEDLVRANAAALDIAAFSANPAEGQAEAVSALARIKRTGRVDNRTLGGLGIGEKTFLDELSRRTGEATKTLKKKMDEGKIAAADSLEALYGVITKKTGKALGGAGADLSTTFEARLTHLRNLPEQYFEKVSKSAGFARLSDAIGKLLDDLDPETPRGKRIFGALETAFDGIATIMASIDLAGIIETATAALATFERGILVVLSHLPGDRGTRAGIQLADFDRRQYAKQQRAFEDEEFTRRADQNLTTPAFERAASEAKTAFGEAAKRAAEGYAGGLSDTERIKLQSAHLGESSLEALRDNLGIRSPSRKFRELGLFSGEGFARGIEDTAPRVDQALDMALAPPARAGGGGRGGNVITLAPSVSVTVHAGGGADAKAIADLATAKVVAELPGMLLGVVENLSQQAGAGA
jgi:hypothetical protein